MKMVHKVVLVSLMALPMVGFAQDSETNVVWKSSVGVGATYKSGNTDKSLFTLNVKGDRFAEKSDWINSLYGEYGKTEGDQTEGQLRGQSEYRYKFGSENFFGGVFSEAYNDTIKQIRIRFKIGPTIGYYFINSDTMKLDVNAGLNYVYERTAYTDGSHAEYRMAANYLWDISETASYYLNVEYSADVEDTNDGNGLLITGLKSKMTTDIALFIELRDEYDNLPDGPEVQYNDVTVLAGVSYEF